jgi:hypothetical protein
VRSTSKGKKLNCPWRDVPRYQSIVSLQPRLSVASGSVIAN